MGHIIKNAKISSESWNVCYRKKQGDGLPFNNDNEPFVVIKNPWNGWCADPFLFHHKGNVYIFAEMYDYILARGVIAYAKLNANSRKVKWKKVICEKFHMSYPYICGLGDEIFIIPETNANNDIVVYKAMNFPLQWKRIYTIKTGGRYVDTTLFQYDGVDYALTYDISNPETYKLKIIKIDENDEREVETDDIRLSRPAGKFLRYNNDYYRPAQVCINDYGEALQFYKCDTTPLNYNETAYRLILPEQVNFDKNIIPLNGMHTYNSIEDYEVIDVKTRRFNLIDLFSRLFHKLFNNHS